MRIIIGLLITAAGAAMVIYANWFYENFGAMGWAEKYLKTSGGTWLGYRLIGVAIAVIGIMVVTNLFKGFAMWIFGPIFFRGGFSG